MIGHCRSGNVSAAGNGSRTEGGKLANVAFVLIVVVFFVLCGLYVRALDRS